MEYDLWLKVQEGKACILSPRPYEPTSEEMRKAEECYRAMVEIFAEPPLTEAEEDRLADQWRRDVKGREITEMEVWPP